MSWKLTLRHLSRYWRLNLLLLIIIVLGASLLAILPMLAATIAGKSLSQTLESAPVHVRNMIVQGKSKTDELPDDIELSLGDLLGEMMAVREGDVLGFPIIYRSDGSQLNLYPATLILNLKSFDRLDERVRVLEGHLPKTDSVSPSKNTDGSPIYEVVIGTDAAHRSGLTLGDELSPAGGNYHLRIVGIVEPIYPDAEVWWGDSQLQPFSAWRRISISPDIDEWNIPLLINPETMTSKIYHQQYWRLILDHGRITTSNAPSVRETLIGLQSWLSDDDMVLQTELIDLIKQYEEDLALAQVSLLLLTFQSLIAVFYLLGMFGNFLVEQSRMELATLSGRGFSRVQITGLFARSTILLALLAGSVAPLVARWFLGLWSNWQGLPVPSYIPVESWWLALSTGLFGWTFLVISVYRATRRDLLPGQGVGMRDDERVLTQRHLIWDIFILTLGGLAYWQLVQGSTITQEITTFNQESVTRISDLVLLLGPTLLLLAVGLIIIRLLPYLWRIFAWISRQGRSLIWNLVFTRLARLPVGPSQVTLLISLTAGLIFFASVFTYTIESWQQTMARYVLGADIRLLQPLVEPNDGINPQGSPGVNGRTQVIRTETTFLVDEYQRLTFDLLAVDPATFPSVVSYPSGASSYSMVDIVGVLQSDPPNGLPIIISSNINTRHLNVGDQITLEMGQETYPFEIVGIIINFPLLDDVFAITDLSQFVQQVDLEFMALTDQGSRETWLAVDPGKHDSVVAGLNQAGFEDWVVGDSRDQLEIFQNNLVFREVTTAFALNALILIPLSVVGFFLIQLFSTHRRAAEFNVLQVMGLSKTQLRGILILEGSMFISVGVLIGVGVGFGLTIVMQPFLSQILPPLRGGLVLDQILINWSEVVVRFTALIGFYGIGYFVLLISAFRNQKSAQF